jgi:hypothetical protein
MRMTECAPAAAGAASSIASTAVSPSRLMA